MPFYVGDWLKAPEVRSLAPDIRGLWFDLICYMWESTERGIMVKPNGKPYSKDEIIRMVGLDNQNSGIWLTTLIDNSVCSVRVDGAIYSRRMVKDQKIRSIRQEIGKKGGNPALLVNHTHNQEVNQNTEYENIYEDANEDINKKHIRQVQAQSNAVSNAVTTQHVTRADEIREDNIYNTMSVNTSEDIQLFFDYFLLKTKKQFRLTTISKGLIAARLKEGYTLDQLRKAVDNFIADTWEGRKNHLDLIYCIGRQKGKPDNLEKWLNIAKPERRVIA